MFNSNGNGSAAPEAEKSLTPDATRRTVQEFPDPEKAELGHYTLFIASIADDIVPWGHDVRRRDQQLRDFWHTEPILAGAVYSVCARNAALPWKIEASKKTSTTPARSPKPPQKPSSSSDRPPRPPSKAVDEATGWEATADAVTQMLNLSNLGKGWTNFAVKGTQDLLTQDNAWFIELIRETNSPESPVIGVNHLDAGRCIRTGNPEIPVIYEDRNNQRHKLKWFQVITVEEMPSSIEKMNGVQYCAVTRILRAAQIIRDLGIYKREKISGRFARAVHLVGGVGQTAVKDAIKIAGEEANNQGLIRYIQPIILASLDPNATVSHEVIELASLPDGFDEDTTLKWYIAQIANGFGGDYQDFAPLPSGNLGTSQQSQILDQKSRLKGSALFMKTLMQAFNYQGVIPQNVSMVFDDEDPAASEAAARLRQQRAATRALRIKSGEIDKVVARQIAIREGDLDPAFLGDLEAADALEAQRQAEETQLKRDALMSRPKLGGPQSTNSTVKPAKPID